MVSSWVLEYRPEAQKASVETLSMSSGPAVQLDLMGISALKSPSVELCLLVAGLPLDIS